MKKKYIIIIILFILFIQYYYLIYIIYSVIKGKHIVKIYFQNIETSDSSDSSWLYIDVSSILFSNYNSKSYYFLVVS